MIHGWWQALPGLVGSQALDLSHLCLDWGLLFISVLLTRQELRQLWWPAALLLPQRTPARWVGPVQDRG